MLIVWEWAAEEVSCWGLRLSELSNSSCSLPPPLTCTGSKLTTGGYRLTTFDEFIDDLLIQDRVCDIILPRLTQRKVLEEVEGMAPRASLLEDDPREAGDDEGEEGDLRGEDADSDVDMDRGRSLSRSRSKSAVSRGGSSSSDRSRFVSRSPSRSRTPSERFVSRSPSLSPDRERIPGDV